MGEMTKERSSEIIWEMDW